MTPTVTRRRLLAGGAVAALTSLAGCSGVTPFVGKRTEEDRTLALDGASSLSVQAQVGDVRVTSEEREDVALNVVKKASSVTVDISKLTLDVSREDGRLRLSSRYEGDTPLFGGSPAMDLTLRVPRSLTVERLESSVGEIDVEGVAGDLSVDAGTGAVRVRDVSGRVDATTSTGDVTVEGADTVGDVSTSTGGLDLTVPAIDGDTRFETSTGDVVAAFGPEVDADLTASTSTGDVEISGLSLADATREDGPSSGRVTGTIGDGGPDLVVETSTGDVTLSAR